MARIRGPILKASARAGKRYGAPMSAAETLAAEEPTEDDDAEDGVDDDLETLAPGAGT